MKEFTVFSGMASIMVIALACVCFGQVKVKEWDVFEIEMTAQDETSNPYVNRLPDDGPGYVKVVFRGETGKAKGKILTVTGFWDGGDTWKVRFAPPAGGEWSYVSHSKDAGLNATKGKLLCTEWSETEKNANPTRRGPVRVCKTGGRAGRYFQYADGTPFPWLGDTWWNWTKRRIKFESFKKLADDRAAKGFNVGQLFFAGRGWGGDSSLLNGSFDRPDFDHLHHIESYIRYANSVGITVWVHGWWNSPHMDKTIGADKIRRWCRYMVHRLGAYNVTWVLSGEYNMNNYGNLGLDFWKQLGALIDAEDPYDRIIGAHPTPPGWGGGAEAPQWSTAEVLHDEDWLDYNQSQTGHGKWRNEMIPRIVTDAYNRKPPKPIVVTEPWYEFTRGSASAEDIRFGAWSAICSGAAGHSYAGGHVWKAHVPEAPAGKDNWPMELSFEVNTLDYPGAVSLGFMAQFLRSIEWWRLSPHPELVLENPSPFCAARPGKEYLIYLRWGGALKVDLKDAAEADTFECKWFDLTKSTLRKTTTIKGGATRTLHPPEDYPTKLQYKDWLLHIKKK
ncbi:MAG: DUF4038 domain-containing protein [Planctomycetes bacterium]|nr:DUF4038 domain-containing protein [Planctomycetota bacterium]